LDIKGVLDSMLGAEESSVVKHYSSRPITYSVGGVENEVLSFERKSSLISPKL